MQVRAWWAAAVVLAAVFPAWASRVTIPFVYDLALDQPRVAVYLKQGGAYLPIGSEGYVVGGLVDTGAAAHVLPRYMADVLLVPIDPAGQAEVLTLCGYTEILDISEALGVGIGPYESENEADFVEVGPHRLAVRIVDPPLSEELQMPMIVGTPFLREYSVFVDWQLIEVFPGYELPQLTATPRPAATPPPEPPDLTLPLTMFGETNLDVVASLPTAWHVPFVDVQLRHGTRREYRQFIVDTGAQISFISTELALALGVDLDSPAGSGLPVIGAGTCSVTLYPYLLDRMIFPTQENVPLVFEQPIVYVMDVPGIDGGIGSNMLFFFDELVAVDIDLGHQRLGLKLNVPIPPAGDADGDGHVNIFDIFVIAESWSTAEGDPAYNEDADLDMDGAVTVFDIFVIAENWGR